LEDIPQFMDIFQKFKGNKSKARSETQSTYGVQAKLFKHTTPLMWNLWGKPYCVSVESRSAHKNSHQPQRYTEGDTQNSVLSGHLIPRSLMLLNHQLQATAPGLSGRGQGERKCLGR